MKIENLSFGSITIDGYTYSNDLIIDNKKIKKRKKKASKQFKHQFAHTPLSIYENIPWNCKKLIIGTGHNSSLPIMKEVKTEATKRNVNLILLNTKDAIKHINDDNTNLIIHLTC
ncbi:MAG: hypothetical protein KAT05_10050 [Spirochaetes bacterium]|nr:hypothetical protein [Spirochaetota bacterium]